MTPCDMIVDNVKCLLQIWFLHAHMCQDNDKSLSSQCQAVSLQSIVTVMFAMWIMLIKTCLCYGNYSLLFRLFATTYPYFWPCSAKSITLVFTLFSWFVRCPFFPFTFPFMLYFELSLLFHIIKQNPPDLDPPDWRSTLIWSYVQSHFYCFKEFLLSKVRPRFKPYITCEQGLAADLYPFGRYDPVAKLTWSILESSGALRKSKCGPPDSNYTGKTYVLPATPREYSMGS